MISARSDYFSGKRLVGAGFLLPIDHSLEKYASVSIRSTLTPAYAGAALSEPATETPTVLIEMIPTGGQYMGRFDGSRI